MIFTRYCATRTRLPRVPTEKSVRGPLRDSRREHLRTGGRSRRWAVRLAATGPFCDPNWYVRPAARLRGRRPHLVLFPRRPRSGEPRPAPATRDPCPAAAPAATLRPRPRLLGRPREALARLARHARHRAARHRHPLAPPRLRPLLALAIAPDRTPLDPRPTCGRSSVALPLRTPGARRESTASYSSSASPSPSPRLPST